MIRKIPTATMSKEEWTALRSTTIGGSDAAAILGLNPYKSPYALWAEKTGKVIPEDISQKEAVRLGTDLEEYVAKRFTEATGKKVRRENYTVFRDDMPYAHANYDRLVIGERAGLEIKTTNALHLSKFKNGEFPATYYAQCCHYLLVSGLDRWYLAVLVLGIDFKVFVIERDEEELEALKEAEESFWENVQSETPPAIDGMDSTIDALNAEFPVSEPETEMDLTGCAVDLAIMDECGQQIKALEERKPPLRRVSWRPWESPSGAGTGATASHGKRRNAPRSTERSGERPRGNPTGLFQIFGKQNFPVQKGEYLMANIIQNQVQKQTPAAAAQQSIGAMLNTFLDRDGMRKRFDELLGKRAPSLFLPSSQW